MIDIRESSGREPDALAERLVRLAGRRQPVPRDRTDRVRAAVEVRWREERRRRRRRATIGIAAALAAAACLLLAIGLRLAPGPVGAGSGATGAISVEALVGSAWSRVAGPGRGESRPLVVGQALGLPVDLVTAGDGSRVALRLPSGHSVRLDGRTEVRWLDGGALELVSGALYVDSGAGNQQSTLVVHTLLGRIREIGTQFEVRLGDDSVVVRLREGAVVVDHDDRSDEVRAGTELTLASDGSVRRRSIASHGSIWQWFAEVTPMPDLQGQSARAFLEWIARERGLELAYANDAVYRSAEKTELGGTIRRLTPDQALDAVLPTCRLTYRLDHGRLLVAGQPREEPIP